MNYLYNVFVLLFLVNNAAGQSHPSEGSRLNYRLVVFSVPQKTGAGNCTLKVAKGSFRKQAKFEENVFIRKTISDHKAAVELPAFGGAYTWQMEYGDKSTTPLYHCYTTNYYITDPAKYRLRMVGQEYANDSLYFFLDYARSLYNSKGEIVWYLPDVPPYVDSLSRIRDLKFTEFGTITFLTDTGAYEVDYDGNLLWKAPGVDNSKGLNYHHEFTRLHSGNYMLLGMEEDFRKMPDDSLALKNNGELIERKDGSYKRILFSNILEYTADKKMVWKWSSNKYFTGERFDLLKMDNGIYMPTIKINGFYFDEPNRVVYAGFRDVSQILKIRYPTSEILAIYGKNAPGTPEMLFVTQHSYNRTKDGHLLIYNNNAQRNNRNSISSIQILKEPESPKDQIEKIWEFNCDIDGEASSLSGREGNVTELSDGNIMCCMGTSPRIFIVNRNKKVLFNCISEKWNNRKGAWDKFPQYRANMLKINDLINFIK